MKKAGSSKSKSKTQTTSSKKSEGKPDRSEIRGAEIRGEEIQAFAQEVTTGHRPVSSLTPQDEALFRAFQSNLLSLISHELRTPLTGILNSLSLLEDPDQYGDFSASELVGMARRNAERLQKTLGSLLDLASIESGTFHARLREIDLPKLVSRRLDSRASALKDAGVQIESEIAREALSAPVLADPQKFGRAVDLCVDILAARAEPGSTSKVRISSRAVAFEFPLKKGLEEIWIKNWSEALAGHHGGVGTPGSAFAGTLQSEEAFLTRMEEGLGSEFLLLHEIMKIHHGDFIGELQKENSPAMAKLVLQLPEFSSEETLVRVLQSRTAGVAAEMGSVALALVSVPEGQEAREFQESMKRALFRASDAAYALPKENWVALVMDDCKPEDIPALMERIQKTLGQKIQYGTAVCPLEGYEPATLIALARKRLAGAAKPAK